LQGVFKTPRKASAVPLSNDVPSLEKIISRQWLISHKTKNGLPITMDDYEGSGLKFDKRR
tara:strand:- start:254 stop:433 length:180 start_codon:yes stop_codon:yes gene_type:complete